MKTIGGTFNGTGAAVYICLGFIPDKVKMRAVEDTDAATLEWDINYRSAEQDNGVVYHTAGGIVPVLLTAGQGIEPYEGGDAMTTTIQTSTANGEGVYLRRDNLDYKASDIIAGSDPIDTWTLDTLGSRTGHFNNDVVGTYIGEGSRICIDGLWYVVEAVAAGQGIAANEVTLSRAAPSGTVEFISNMYDYAPVPIGDVAPAGFKCNKITYINENDELQAIEASIFDF